MEPFACHKFDSGIAFGEDFRRVIKDAAADKDSPLGSKVLECAQELPQRKFMDLAVAIVFALHEHCFAIPPHYEVSAAIGTSLADVLDLVSNSLIVRRNELLKFGP